MWKFDAKKSILNFFFFYSRILKPRVKYYNIKNKFNFIKIMRKCVKKYCIKSFYRTLFKLKVFLIPFFPSGALSDGKLLKCVQNPWKVSPWQRKSCWISTSGLNAAERPEEKLTTEWLGKLRTLKGKESLIDQNVFLNS